MLLPCRTRTPSLPHHTHTIPAESLSLACSLSSHLPQLGCLPTFETSVNGLLALHPLSTFCSSLAPLARHHLCLALHLLRLTHLVQRLPTQHTLVPSAQQLLAAPVAIHATHAMSLVSSQAVPAAPIQPVCLSTSSHAAPDLLATSRGCACLAYLPEPSCPSF